MTYMSQSGVEQDRYLNEKVFFGKRDGFFIDIGAHDGVTYSNSCFFERELGWSGICVEPILEVFELLEKSRTAKCIQAAVCGTSGVKTFTRIAGAPEMLSGIRRSYDQRHLNRIGLELVRDGGKLEDIEVRGMTFGELMALTDRPVDFCSIDTEGSEFEIMSAVDFTMENVPRCFVIENNYASHEVENLMTSHGYYLIQRLSSDEVYLKGSLISDWLAGKYGAAL